MYYHTNEAYFAYAQEVEGEKFGENCPQLRRPSHDRFSLTTTPYFTNPRNPEFCGSFSDYGFVGVGEQWKTSYAGNDNDVYYHPVLNLLVFVYNVADIRVGKGGFKSQLDLNLFYEYQMLGAKIIAVSRDFFSNAIVSVLSQNSVQNAV